MSKVFINSSQLSDEIVRALRQYTDEVEVGIEKAKKKAAQDTVKIIKEKAPVDTGFYKTSWTMKRTAGGGYIVYARNYQITHLLEKGHAKVGGGRVAAIPHIAPAEEQGIEQYIKSVERVIKNG